MGDTVKVEKTKPKVQETGFVIDLPEKTSGEKLEAFGETIRNPPKQSALAAKEWDGYLTKHHVNAFQYEAYVKLAILQDIPRAFVDFRKIGNKEMPYLKYEFAQKALNFAFNFDYDVEIVKSGEAQGSSSGGKKFTEVTLEVKFTFRTDQRVITKTIFSGHKGYDNPATTKADVYKAALSKAYTVVARTFGIGSNVKGMTKQGVAVNTYQAENAQVYAEPAQAQAPAPKSFGTDGMGGPSF